jgi:hypothetical protein
VKLNNVDEEVDLYTTILRFSPDNEEAKDFLMFYGEESIMRNTSSRKKQPVKYYRF